MAALSPVWQLLLIGLCCQALVGESLAVHQQSLSATATTHGATAKVATSTTAKAATTNQADYTPGRLQQTFGSSTATKDMPAFPAPPPSSDALVFPRFRQGQSVHSMQTVSTNMEAEAGAKVGVLGNTQENAGIGEGARLVNALRQLNVDINAASQQVISEDKWIKDVTEVMGDYMKKIHNVKMSIKNNRLNIRKMLQKKRKVENLMLQKQLEVKLSEATGDLTTLTSAMDQVKSKEANFAGNKAEVEFTIQRIKAQLAKLKGTSVEGGSGEAAGEGGEEEGSSGGSTA